MRHAQNNLTYGNGEGGTWSHGQRRVALQAQGAFEPADVSDCRKIRHGQLKETRSA